MKYNKESNIEKDWVLNDEKTVHIAVVACGDRQKETMVMLKSATILTKEPLFFHIFSEKQLQQQFIDDVSR